MFSHDWSPFCVVASPRYPGIVYADKQLNLLFRLKGHLPEKDIAEFLLFVKRHIANRKVFFLRSGDKAEIRDHFGLIDLGFIPEPQSFGGNRKSDRNRLARSV